MPPRKRKEGAGPVRLLSVREIGEALGLGPEGARSARQRGQLPPADFVIGPGGRGTYYAWLPERAEEARKQRQEKLSKKEEG
jgi:hypothetical protein